MLAPLQEWFCDNCNQVIAKPGEGNVVWRQDAHNQWFDFKIMHKNKCAIGRGYFSSAALEDFLGEKGVNYLLSMLSPGMFKITSGQPGRVCVKDIDEFVDFYRRVQVSYYEEARAKFNRREIIEEFAHVNAVSLYQVDMLRRIAERPIS